MRFTPAISTQLADPESDRVRRNVQRQIEELQRTVQAMSAGTGAWELVEPPRVLAADATSVGFSNLRGNTDIEYRIRGYVRDAGVSNTQLVLRPNGATTNQRGQQLQGSATTAAAATTSTLPVCTLRTTGGVATFTGIFVVQAGALRVYEGTASHGETTTPSTRAEVFTGYWSDTTAEVVSLLLVGGTDALASGSRFTLERRSAAWR